MIEATTVLCYCLGELDSEIRALGEQGFRIVTVLDSQNGTYTVVAQKGDLIDLGNVIRAAVYDALVSAQ